MHDMNLLITCERGYFNNFIVTGAKILIFYNEFFSDYADIPFLGFLLPFIKAPKEHLPIFVQSFSLLGI